MLIKDILRYLLFVLKHKNYKCRVQEKCHLVQISNSDNESFYGYYDKSPERNGKILFHEKDNDRVNVVVLDKLNNEKKVIAKVCSFNWQMGARAIWVTDDVISYNDFDGSKYICQWFSLKGNKIVRTYNQPLQDVCLEKGYFIGINYRRLCSYAKEYGYYCLPEMSDEEFCNYSHDGIWHVDIESDQTKLLIPISDLLKNEKQFSEGKHFVNHVMINPSGKSFIFIHRFYIENKRYDRLMFYDFKQLKCLMNGQMQSHYCWLEENLVFGYGEQDGKKGFYSINVITHEVIFHRKLTEIHPRDGHPTKFGKWVVIDSYPDLSRMQSLIAYNIKTEEIVFLGEFFHDLKHKGYTRCDLHPRFSMEGNKVYIDTIYSGKRQLVCLNVEL